MLTAVVLAFSTRTAPLADAKKTLAEGINGACGYYRVMGIMSSAFLCSFHVSLTTLVMQFLFLPLRKKEVRRDKETHSY